MTTRSSATISADIKSYLDDAIKNLVTKSDIDSLKSFIEEQSAPIKNLTEKIWTLDEKLNASEASIEKLNDKITNLEGKLAYFESQDELKSRKIDYLKQYGRQESLRFSGFEVKENESKEECESKVKIYIKDCMNVDIEESEFNRIHRIGPEINKNGKAFQQIIVKFKGFVPRTKCYRAMKQKSDIVIHLDLTKRRYLLLNAYGKAKNCASVEFACADINCSLCLRLKNGNWKFFNSLEELEKLLLEIQ